MKIPRFNYSFQFEFPAFLLTSWFFSVHEPPLTNTTLNNFTRRCRASNNCYRRRMFSYFVLTPRCKCSIPTLHGNWCEDAGFSWQEGWIRFIGSSFWEKSFFLFALFRLSYHTLIRENISLLWFNWSFLCISCVSMSFSN